MDIESLKEELDDIHYKIVELETKAEEIQREIGYILDYSEEIIDSIYNSFDILEDKDVENGLDKD